MKIKNQKGEISRVLLVLAGVVLLIIIVIFIFARFIGTSKSGLPSSGNSVQPSSSPTPTPSVYEAKIGDIKFALISSENLGNIIKAKNAYDKDLTTTERFIKVTIGAQNQGKNNTEQYAWDLGNIVDSEGRNFIVINDYSFSGSQTNVCGSILKPEFAPIQCSKIYEVARVSTGLKVQVTAGAKKQKALIDLKI